MAKTTAPDTKAADVKAAAPAGTAALAVVTERQQALAVADKADPKDVSGKEGITQEDMQIEFVAVAQKSSGALDADDSAFVEGLKLGQMYNSVTGDNYGNGPLLFLPIISRKRAHLTDPSTGRMGERVAWDDPRVTKEGAEARRAQGLKPEGQRIYDWVALLVPSMSLVVISFKSTSAPAGRLLNKLVATCQGPSFARMYKLTTTVEQNDAGKYGVIAVAPAGKPDDDQFEYAKTIYGQAKSITIPDRPDEKDEKHVEGEVVERKGGDPEQPEIPF